MWSVPGNRIKLDLDGPSVEVEPIHAWSIFFETRALRAIFDNAKTPADEYSALTSLFNYVALEAQPQWDIVDHRGAVPPTGRGFHRLELKMALQIVDGWANSFNVQQEEVQSAADVILAPGPVRDEVKRRLKKKNA